jgi:F-type H+-transporting ATPase subunit a
VALCIRLFANMTAGHLVLFVILGMAAGGRGWGLLYVSIPGGLGAMAMLVLELLVAVIQAYVFTFLSAIFIGMAVNPQH